VTTTFYVGNYFEKVGGITRTYYYHGGKRVAMRENNALYWLLTDHLGSTSRLIAATSALTGELRYKAYGETRYAWGITNTTKYQFTGQREESVIGLYFYNARWYDAALGRFAQADTIVPSPGNPQSLNRYTYGSNNPVLYIDPSGHAADAGLHEASDEYLWWSLFHPSLSSEWRLWQYLVSPIKSLVASHAFAQHGQAIVDAATAAGIPAGALFSVVRQEGANPFKIPALGAALLGENTTVGLAEVSVRTAESLIKGGYLKGPTGRTELVLALGLSDRYSIQAGAAAYKRASDVARDRLPNLPPSLRQYYVLAMYNRGEKETLGLIQQEGVGAFAPEAVRYIHCVMEYSPSEQQVRFWALVSNLAEALGQARW
jgi:RHS repeat-associated protein